MRRQMPLMSDLRDLDLELELLKRKRQVIEQQQELLNQQRFDTPQTYGQQLYNANDNFSQRYNDDQNGYGQRFGQKRQSGGSPWQGSSAKRFARNEGGGLPSPWEADSAPAPFHDYDNYQPRPAPSFRKPPNRPNNTYGGGFKERPREKNFKPPGKVVKAKNVPAKVPNKLRSQPPERRRELVAAAAGAKSNTDDILRADTEPTFQMRGRLEMSLGAILKEIKEVYAKDPRFTACFEVNELCKAVKQGIRDRIRSAMIDKHVGPTVEIINAYRKMFPKDKDIDILNAVNQDGANSKQREFISADNAFDFLKFNSHKLLQIKMNEMFMKLKRIMVDENHRRQGTIEIEVDDKDATEKQVDNTEPAPKTEDAAPEQPARTGDLPTAPPTPTTPATPSTPATPATPFTPATPPPRTLAAFAIKYPDLKDYLNDVDVYLTEQLIRIIPRLTESAIKTVDTGKLLSRWKYFSENKTSADAATDSDLVRQPLPYYLKVMGKPTLPKRQVMRAFINQFNPGSIKKLREHNVLFIGFKTKEDYDNMLSKNQTVIGQSTIIIKASENKNKDAANENEDSTTQDNDGDISMSSLETDKVLTGDLDDQIDDLLSSIRKAEEEGGTVEDVERSQNIDDNDSVEETVPEDEQNEAVDEQTVAEENTDTQQNGGDKVEEKNTEAEHVEVSVKTEEIKNDTAEKADSTEAAVADAGAKQPVPATPVRASARLAANPAAVQTRRATKTSP